MIFIATVQRQLNKEKKEEKINYKMLKKKTQKSKSEGTLKKRTKRTGLWF
jgi:hypothetical protein